MRLSLPRKAERCSPTTCGAITLLVATITFSLTTLSSLRRSTAPIVLRAAEPFVHLGVVDQTVTAWRARREMLATHGPTADELLV